MEPLQPEQQDALLLLFVKHPRAGQTKTRLAAGIGHAQALAVYRELLAKLEREARAVGCPVAVFYGNEVPDQDLWAETGWPRLRQQGADLGARMHQAFMWGQARGYRRQVLVGSDIPGLSADLLRGALDALHTHQVVLGPSVDGGYYLLGLQQPQAALFTHMTWSTDEVLAETERRIQALGLSHHRAPLLNDIDTVEDLPGTFLAGYASSSD